MRQNGSCFIGKRGTFQNASEMRQNCVKMRQKCAEHLRERTPFGRYRKRQKAKETHKKKERKDRDVEDWNAFLKGVSAGTGAALRSIESNIQDGQPVILQEAAECQPKGHSRKMPPSFCSLTGSFARTFFSNTSVLTNSLSLRASSTSTSSQTPRFFCFRALPRPDFGGLLLEQTLVGTLRPSQYLLRELRVRLVP